MTRNQFIYALTACGCLLKDGKTWYEHNELIKCFEDLGLFEQEPFINKPCVSSGVCEHDKNKTLDKIRAEILEKCFDVPYKNQAFDYGLKIVKWNDVHEIIDKYKAETEET